ncbi:MAG: potassium-transporting ATPase subunit KdpB, partial [Actinomycetota bacterium]
MFDVTLLWRSLPDAFRKLDPRQMWRNPVMFVVEIGSALTTILFVRDPSLFTGLITLWLWLTVAFANLAEAVAEGRGKAQAAALRATRTESVAWRLLSDGRVEEVPGTEHVPRDRVAMEAGQVIPGDGEVVEGVASVDESAITGESAPVIRESGGDRSAVTGGTKVLSDRIVVEITSRPGETFIDRMIALVEGAERQKTPNEIALNILLASLTIVFLLATVTLQPMAIYSGARQSIIVLVALLVCLIPTTIGALLSAIGIAGMDRMVQRNVLAMSGKAVETAGDIDTLLLDKTGTITYGNRLAAEFIPVGGHEQRELVAAALRASLADETPEGRSIVELAGTMGYQAGADGAEGELIPFSAETRMSGISMDGHKIMKGAVDAISKLAASVPQDLEPTATRIAAA